MYKYIYICSCTFPTSKSQIFAFFQKIYTKQSGNHDYIM